MSNVRKMHPLVPWGSVFLWGFFHKIGPHIPPSYHPFVQPNHFLLEQLAQKIPPTFRHSIQVGVSAAFGAKALKASNTQIGATLVAGYFHDIAKLWAPKPNIFYEINQGSRIEQIAVELPEEMLWILDHPRLSAEILMRNDFPDRVINAVESHHGTMNSRVKKGPQIAHITFAYPGPRPTSLEGAMVMLADSAEARIDRLRHSANETDLLWTRDNLTRQVLNVAKTLWQDGQFIECRLGECRLGWKQLSKAAVEIAAALYIFDSSRVRDPFEIMGEVFNGKAL